MLAFLTAFLFAMITLPVVIRISHSWGLVDAPSGGRKLHSAPVPFVGGLVIFAGTLIVTGLFANPNPAELMPLLKLAAVATVLLLTGLFDDMEGLSPGKKLLVHFAVGIVLILGADLRIEGFGGLFGVGLLPYAVSAFFSLFVYIVVVNAINLIDGVDGLAGGYGLLVCGGFGSWFLVTGQPGFAVLAFALAGTLAGFTIFNTSPARIFMGDNGSLVLGVCIFAFSMKMMGTHSGAIPAAMQGFSLPVLAMTFLAYPLVDTLRVFAIRILRGKSPLSADRNHLHHRLLGLGFGHKGTALTVHLYTIAMISLFFWLPQGTAAMAFAGQFGCAIILPATINIAIRLKTAKGRRTAQSNS
jgi:UDP-GlcNAc:undecaprenyl-phosphate GlcNAc-1-phosphate transferase